MGVDRVYRGEVPAADRDYSRSKWSEDGSFAEATGVSAGSNTVFFENQEGNRVARALGDCSTDYGYTGVLSNPNNVDGQGCGFPYGNIPWTQIRTEMEDVGDLKRLNSNSVFANFDAPLGEAVSVYMDGRLTWADTAFRYAPPVGTFDIPKGFGATAAGRPSIRAIRSLIPPSVTRKTARTRKRTVTSPSPRPYTPATLT